MDKFFRIFDRNHNILDELYDFEKLKYGWTLDDIDTLEVQFSLSDPKCTPENMRFCNHIELVDGENNIVWGGIIAGHSFEDSSLKINCYDYSYLLKKRRLRAKQYGAMEYGALMQQMISDCSAVNPDYLIGLTGFNIASGVLQTTREVKATDFLWDKIKDFGDDGNYDYGVGSDRRFNFWLRKGKDKPDYVLQWGGGEDDNINVSPTLARDILSTVNSIYGEVSVNESTISSSAEDKASESLYGLLEGTYSTDSSITEQSTLNARTNSELQKTSVPADSITLNVEDSTLCPFSAIEVGDRVTLHLIPYFDYTASVRIIRMVHDEDTGLRELTVGNIIFRPQPPTKRLYKR